MRTIRNVYACLVHERQECVVDLVRNLRYLDPCSHILLYNGGPDPALLDGGFPWQNYRAVVHPQPRAMVWGRLHDFALDCMRFALDELPFDTLTIVDSDQLALRAGYPARLSRFLADKQGVGMLGNSPAPQTWGTHIAPARAALREAELWRPFLRRFEGGEAKFVHWSFWPSTVFTADAARALTDLFASDAELQEIMRRTKIWATEEVILPTLLALLDFKILANPCSDDYLKFRVRFTPRQLDAALAREDVFWVHPVARNDRDGLRRHIRARLNQYEKPFEEGSVMPSNDANQPAAQGPELLLTLPIIARMKTVEGWLWEEEADLLIAVTSRALRDLPAPHKVVEVGSYCGRSTVVFGSVVKALRPDAKVYAVDPHDGCVGATDQRITKTAPTLEKFQWNIWNAGLTETVELIQKYSHEVEWRDPISLLFIDGLHDYSNVARDFFHFERFVVEGGYVAFHDYADYYPGVKTFVNEVLSSGRYRKVHCAMSMIVVQKLRAAESSGDDEGGGRRAAEQQPARETTVVEPPIAARPLPAPAAAAEPRAAVQPAGASAHAGPLRKVPRGERFDRLSAFRGVHEGESVVVCGCGESLNELERPEEFLTVGVNDVGRRFQPNYLVVINPRNQFKGDRFRYVEQSRADYLFTQLDLGLPNRNVIRFRLGSYGGTDFKSPDVLHYTQNSPYVALCLAAHMGARRIGVIGVDFTDHHFFARTGRHALSAQLKTIDEQYRRLGAALAARGVEVFNLSRTSRLTAFPKLSVAAFAARAHRKAEAVESAPLKVVSYATTPVAGVPAILARCIEAKTPPAARCVWAARGYGNGVTFDGDVEWSRSPAKALEELESADVVIVHNGKVEPSHRKLVAGKAVVTMAHNYLWNVDQTYVKQGFPGVVVGQYQATLAEFKGWSVVPNPVPLWEPQFQPGDKGEAVTVCYTPSGKHERYAPSHRLYWHSKGYDTTMRVLDRLAARYPVRLEVIRDRQVSHAESLAMKRRSHVVIDECVTGSYHRNSLEGLSAGCVVVNGVGLLPAVREVLRSCSGDDASPFVFSDLEALERTLTALVERGAETLAADGALGRLWMERRWDFARQWETFWSPVIDRALQHAGKKPRSLKPAAHAAATSQGAQPPRAPSHEEVAAQATSRPATSAQGVSLARPAANAAGAEAEPSGQLARASTRGAVSVVIPHGGRDRLRNLTATLSNLRACPDVGEVIVVDTGAAPTAEAAARRLAEKYLFVRHDGLFNRARALNAGAALAECEHLLWQDNDLISAPDFLKKALEELAARRLDCLLPWTSIRYLSAGDSVEVCQGARRAADCRPAHAWTNRHAVGGAMLVRKGFVLQYGGMCEEFEGWGGEDNAWFHKAKVLGRLGITRRTDQHLFHLYHDKSGGYTSTNHTEKNPRYNTNLALLLATRRLTDRAQFLRRFPPPKHFSCPWETHKRLAFLGEGSGASAALRVEAAHVLSALYGIEVEHAVAASTGAHARDEQLRGTLGAGALVIFGAAAALRFLSDDSREGFWPRTLVVHDAPPCAAFSPAEAAQLRRARGHLTLSAEVGRALAEAGLSPWVAGGRFAETGERARRLALALAQPLSLLLAEAWEDSAANGAEDAALKVLAETQFSALAGAGLIQTTNSQEHGT